MAKAVLKIMEIDISASFAFQMDRPTDSLLQFEAAALADQRLLHSRTDMIGAENCRRVPGQDGIGERIWLEASGRFEVDYQAALSIERPGADIAALAALAPHDLPGEEVPYLLDSCYCPADRFQNFVDTEFAGTVGGERIMAINRWIGSKMTYSLGISTANTTALDSFVERKGICRDFAHVMITLARASAIPARYVSVYAPDVEPEDFHAIAEVFLADAEGAGGRWLAIDPTGMARVEEMAVIGVGRDAADVSFLTTFGSCTFLEKHIRVTRRQPG